MTPSPAVHAEHAGEPDEPLPAVPNADDRAAMHRIYLDTVEVVTRFLGRRVPPGDVEDLVAETYARAMAALPRFADRGAPVRAWLLRIALNLAIDVARSSRVRTTIPTDDIAEHADHDVRSRVPDPSTAWAERHDSRVQLRRAFAALEPAQRVAVGLRHLEGLPVAEVALVLDISEPAVRALTYRGMTALRTAMSARPDADQRSSLEDRWS